MANKAKKKGEAGKKAQYYGRNKCLRVLQLSLANFRRICIYKGVFPREASGKLRYYKKDILYLSHDPLISHFRQERLFKRKLKTLKGKNDMASYNLLLRNKPALNLEHIIKERYPSFNDALKDLDDALCMLFVFANSPILDFIPVNIINEAQKLTTEFMNYVICSKSLRKVFISIKGYYFQACINNIDVTWIIPHNFVPSLPKDVDFKVMRSFSEFYVTFLAFVNCHLYNLINMVYPPKIQGGINAYKKGEKLSDFELRNNLLNTLNVPIVSNLSALPPPPKLDKFDNIDEDEIYYLNLSLFEGKKFFLSREIPKQPFVFAIRSFGGVVSWADELGYGVTYQENEPSITHQIIDRPSPINHFVGRAYIQPQWIFDSINAGKCLPTEKYVVNCELPPHRSPFKVDRHSQLLDQFKTSENKNENLPQEVDKKVLTTEERKLAELSLPRKSKKLYDKLQKIKKMKKKEEDKLESKRKIIAQKS